MISSRKAKSGTRGKTLSDYAKEKTDEDTTKLSETIKECSGAEELVTSAWITSAQNNAGMSIPTNTCSSMTRDNHLKLVKSIKCDEGISTSLVKCRASEEYDEIDAIFRAECVDNTCVNVTAKNLVDAPQIQVTGNSKHENTQVKLNRETHVAVWNNSKENAPRTDSGVEPKDNSISPVVKKIQSSNNYHSYHGNKKTLSRQPTREEKEGFVDRLRNFFTLSTVPLKAPDAKVVGIVSCLVPNRVYNFILYKCNIHCFMKTVTRHKSWTSSSHFQSTSVAL